LYDWLGPAPAPPQFDDMSTLGHVVAIAIPAAVFFGAVLVGYVARQLVSRLATPAGSESR
jgi:hypothetical protein